MEHSQPIAIKGAVCDF